MEHVTPWIPVLVGIFSGVISGLISSAVQKNEIRHLWREFDKNERDHAELWHAVRKE